MTRLVLITCVLPIFAQYIHAATETETALANVRSALQGKQFTDALVQIDAALATADEGRDDLLYLKGLALFYNKDFTAASQVCDQFLTAHPNSEWLRKATFLQAQCYLNLKEFERAEAIYNAEVNRLLSSGRKTEIAQVYIRFAESVSRLPDKNDLDSPPPNHQKAYNLYQKALGLEIDAELRAEIMYRLGRMMQLAGNYPQAIRDYQTYLAEFDPRPNLSPDPSPERRGGKAETGRDVSPFPLREGGQGVRSDAHRYEARYHLVACQIAIDQHQLARINLEELLKRLEASPPSEAELQNLSRDARFLLTRTYHFPAPQTDEELELGAQAAKRFMTDFPGDSRSMSLAYEIAQAFQGRGRSEDALRAFQDFLAGKGFTLPTGAQLNAPTKDETGESFAERHSRLRMSATFEVGQIRFDQQNYAGAIESWKGYISAFPNGPQWTDAQQRIIDAEFQIGVTYLTEEKYEDAVRAFDAFQAAHPLDDRVRQILLIYGQIHVHKAETLEKEGGQTDTTHYQQAIAEWEKLVSKYPNTEESSLALFRIAEVYEVKLGELEKALESYRKLTWGSWQEQAQFRIRQMTEKQLKLVTQRTFRTNEGAKVQVNVRNIEALTVNLYKVNLEAYWRKMNGIKGVEDLDLALIAPDKTWEYRVPDYQKYKPFELTIDIPIEGPGVYAVQVGEEDLESTTLVVRSDIEAIIKTSRREVLVFAQDMRKGEPVPNARVLVSDGSQVILEGVTGVDGVYHQKHDGLKDATQTSVFVMKDGNVASDLLDLSGLGLSQGLTPRGYIYTDRPAYRPGQTVSIRGIIRDVKDGSYAVAEGAQYKVSVIDTQGRLLREEEVKLSAFGTFNTEMLLDENAALGEYRIQAQAVNELSPLPPGEGPGVRSLPSPLMGEGPGVRVKIFTGSFFVQRFQLEKVQLTLDFPRQVYFRGEQIEAAFTASYYYGQPVKSAKIRYTLPDGQSYTEAADDRGKLRVVFDTALMQPGTTLHFSGSVEGENASVGAYVTLAHLGFSIEVKPAAEVALSGEPLDVSIKTVGADGKPVGQMVTVTVLRMTYQLAHPILSQLPWLNAGGPVSAEVPVQTHQVQTDANSGIGRIQLTLTEGGEYTLRASGTDRFGQPVVNAGIVTISDDKDVIKLRIFAEQGTTQVGASETLRIHSRLTPTLALVTFEGEGIIDYKVLSLKPGVNPLQFTVGHQHFPNFYLAVAAIDGQQLRTAGKGFTVERQLNLTIRQRQDSFDPPPVYTPGEMVELHVHAADQLGKPVKAELSLALVDEALFAIYPEALTPINDFFQEGIRRVAAMRTASSCTFRYEPPTRRVIKEILAEEKRLEAEEERQMREEAERTQYRASSDKPKGIIVRIANPEGNQEVGTMVLNDEIVGMPELSNRMRTLPEPLKGILIVQPEANVFYGQVAQVIAIAKKAGVDKVALAIVSRGEDGWSQPVRGVSQRLQGASPEGETYLTIDLFGGMYISGNRFASLGELGEYLAVNGWHIRTLIIQADENARIGLVAQVIDLARMYTTHQFLSIKAETPDGFYNGLERIEILQAKEPPKPQVRKPVIKPTVLTENTVVVEQVQMQPRVTTAAVARLGRNKFADATLFEAVAESAPAVREEFAAAGHWIGAIVTDDAGMATVTVPMPEKTTKWRFTARGCTVDTLVGELKVNAITRKDFFLDLKAPSIVTEGDKIRVYARLHNLTDVEGSAELKLTIGVDGKIHTVTPKTVQVKKQDTTEVIFELFTIPAGQGLSLEITANMGELNDGLRRSIPIRPWGMEYTDTKSGTAAGNTTLYLELPSNQRYTSKRLTIGIGQSVSRLIYDLAMNTYHPRIHSFSHPIIPMPGDTGSDLLAVAYALGYVKAAGGYATDNRNLVEAARTYVSRLVTSQHDDGGWSWVPQPLSQTLTHREEGGGEGMADSDPYVTSRNLWAMAEARRQGIRVDEQAVAKATTYLKNAFAKAEQSDDETKAVILHAISTVEEADFAYANRLYRNRNRLSASALAYTALIFVNLNRPEIAGEILDLIPPSLPAERGKGGEVETTALALLAMEAVRPNAPWVKQAVDYLIAQRAFYGYSPYKAKGPVVAALATYYQRTQHIINDYKLRLTVNDREIQTIEMRRDAPNAVVNVPTEMFIDGQNKIVLTLDGRGTYTYIASLSGFSPQIEDPKSWEKPYVADRRYYHAPLAYRGRPIDAMSTTEITQLPAGERTYITVNVVEGYADRYLVVDEYFPAGTTLVNDSVAGSYQHYEVGDGVIRFYYPPRQYVRDYRYQLVNYTPGDYRALPTVIHDALRPGEMRIGKASSLTALRPGEPSTDPYRMNDAERYALGKAYFDDGNYSDALPLLSQLHERNPDYNEKDTARMLLWIYTTKEHYDARKVVEAFEILRERYPELYIPFDNIRIVGTAYRDIKEFERASLVYQATIDASFVNDANVSAVLGDEGQFIRSIDFMEQLWREYPDTAPVVSAYFALSQSLYANKWAPSGHGVPERKGTAQTESGPMTKQDVLQRTANMLSQFLTLYPTHPLADDAAFSLTNVFLDLEDFQTVVRLCQLEQKRYPDSDFLTSFQYVEALGLFSIQKYNEAIQAATPVAESDSTDRDLARYILGQVYHAQGKPDRAIDWYSRVKAIYPDAGESIAYFEEKRISLPEVSIKRPALPSSPHPLPLSPSLGRGVRGEGAVGFTLKYRNVKEAAIQVYRVDLMKLYLQEKDLNRVTQVRLAGIEPAVSQTVTLGDGKDYVDKSREITLPLTNEGAYLVICRGDNLFASGLIVITPLEIEVQEDAVSGRVRVNVRDVVSGSYQPKVHVKTIGSADPRLISGETDLRGVFIADGVRGKTTIIARDSTNRYAFYRGTQWLGAPEQSKQQQAQLRSESPQGGPASAPRQPMDYRMNLELKNRAIQSSNVEEFDKMRREQQGGVQVQKAY